MPYRKFRRNTRKYSSSKRFNRSRRFITKRTDVKLSRRISALSKRVAGECFKFTITPANFSNVTITGGSGSVPNYTPVINNQVLYNITSGTPWIMPLNWVYEKPITSTASQTSAPWYNGTSQGIPPVGVSIDLSLKQPIEGVEYQYRLAYIYINALFNASFSNSTNNTDGALRIVIVKDKQATGGAATWADVSGPSNSRGVFTSNNINALLNPQTLGRFKIMYDKTLKFSTTNGYKPFKYFKRISSIVRQNTTTKSNTTATLTGGAAQTSDQSPPVEKNAFYLMMFPDGVSFTYSTNSETPALGFNLLSRIGYFNN